MAFAPSVMQRRNNSVLPVFCNQAFAAAWINLLPRLRTLAFSISLVSKRRRRSHLAVVMWIVFVDAFLPNENETAVLSIYLNLLGGTKQRTEAKSQ